MTSVAVLGAGAWGTAIACALAARHRVVLYARDPRQAQDMRDTGANERYLRGVRLPHELIVVDDFEAAVRHAGSGLLVIATPTRALGDICADWPRRGRIGCDRVALQGLRGGAPPAGP